MGQINVQHLDNPFRDEKIARIRDELKVRNEVKVGAWFLVRVPKMEGRIFLRNQVGKRTYVELIYDNRYDPETQKTRNRRVSIGQVLDWFPGVMIPNEKYYEWFDRETGELKERGGDAESAQMGEMKEEGEDDVDRKLRDAIENVLERENLIRPSERTMQDRIRKSWETEHDADNCEETGTGIRSETVSGPEVTGTGVRTETGAESETERESETKRTVSNVSLSLPDRKRVRILLDILTGLRDVIKDQARKRPGEIINGFQAEKINSVLKEIKRIEERKGFGDLLEMIRMPEENVDDDGNLVLTGGMTYSDAEVLLEYYNSVIWFTQGDREMG